MSGIHIVEELAARLGLEIDEGAFSAAEKIMHGLTHGLLGMGAALGAYAAGMQALMFSTEHAALAASKAAQETGATTDAIQELHFAAEASGVSAEELDLGLEHLSRTAYAASRGSAEAAHGFSALGVRVTDGAGKLKSSDVLLGEVAAKFARMPEGIQKTALAQELFSRGGARLLPVLNKGAEGIAELREEAREYGLVLSAETIQDAKEFHAANHALEASLTGLKYAIGGPLLKGAGDLAKAFAHLVVTHRAAIAGFVRKPYELLRDALKWIAENVWAVRLALTSLATYIFLTHLPAIGAAIASAIAWASSLTLAGVAATAAGIASAAGAALAVAGWAALAIVVALLADEIYTFVTGGESYLGDLQKHLDDFFNNPEYDPKKTWIGQVLDYLQVMLYTATHIGETFESWKDAFTIGGPTGKGWLGDAMRFVTGGEPLAPASAFGPASASPSASASASAGAAGTNVVDNRQMKASIEVHAAPGMDSKQLAQETVDQITEWWNGTLQEAIPAVAGNR